jgi:hypothetical protein
MSVLNCSEVEEQIELYALHECDAATGEAVAGHLARCRSCARAYQEARQLLGLLDLHLRQDKALARLKHRLVAEGRRGMVLRLGRPGVRSALALAALLLLTLGLSWLAGPGLRTGGDSDGTLVAQVWPGDRLVKVPEMVQGHEAAVGFPARGGADAVKVRLPSIEFLQELEGGRRTGKLPPPPAVQVAMRLTNRGDRPMELLLEKGRYDLTIDLRGPGVAREPAAGPALEPFAAPGKVRLPPGGAWEVTVQRLSEVTAGRVTYVYWTKAGEYQLSIRLRLPVAQPPGAPAVMRTLTTPPMRVRVNAEP